MKTFADKCFVVFVDNTSLWWLHLLKKDFRHCYILFETDSGEYLELNPMSNKVFITIRNNIDFSTMRYCEIKMQKAPLKCAPLGFFTCVEFVKRIIGIHDFFIITPYQLFLKLSTI